MRSAGFVGVRIEEKLESAAFIQDWMPGSGAERYITAAYVTATKPLPLPLAAVALACRWVPLLGALAEGAAELLLSRLLGLQMPKLFTRGSLVPGSAPAARGPPPAKISRPQAERGDGKSALIRPKAADEKG
jgi:hypothetical protein